MFPYPATDEAVPEIQKLVGMLTGNVPAELDIALHSVWVTQGYVQGLAIGMPEPAETAAIASATASSTIMALEDPDTADKAALELLTKLADIDPLAPQAQGLLDGFGGRAALTLLLPILQKWLINWLQNGGLQDLITKVQPS